MSECLEYPSLACGPWGPEAFTEKGGRRVWRYVLVGLLAIVLLGSVTLALSSINALGSGSAATSVLTASRAARLSGLTFSGDDLYDPAAGANPARSVTFAARTQSGDDAYDLAAGGLPALFVRSASPNLSGDDLYDPAAGARLARSVFGTARTYSGDDAYDPAAGR
jgi:hypothetical protein